MFGEKNQFFEIKTFCHSLWKLDYHNFDYIDNKNKEIVNYSQVDLYTIRSTRGDSGSMILNKNNAEILYNALLQRYPNGMRPISDLSRNTDGVPGGKKFIECPHLAFNYDLVTNCATNNGVKEKSPDSLFLDVDRLHFIEFKEGQAKRIELRQKIHEALVTLFQFAITNNILNRDEFLALDFRYTVVRRLQKQHPMANALDISIDNFQLKNK
jgi:hypothetical protein